MLGNIFLFELSQRLRRLSTYIYFLVFFVLGAVFALISGGAIAGSSVEFGTGGKVLINSPYALNVIITYISFFGIIITAAIAGQATYQDIDNNAAVFFYTAPITKLDYLGGRFLAAFAVQIFIFSSVGLGAWIGTLLPWLDKTRLGPQIISAYFQPYFITVLPNLLVITAIFFALATLTRKMLPVYVAGVLVLIAYFTVGQFSNNLNISVTSALADALGGNAIDRITRYWTPFQRNTQLIPLQGILLANRALWLGVGAIFLVLTYRKFRFAYPEERSKTPPANRRSRTCSCGGSIAHRSSCLLGGRFVPAVVNANANSVCGDGQEHFLPGADAGRRTVRHPLRHRNQRPVRHGYLPCHLPDAAERGLWLRHLRACHHHFLLRRTGMAGAGRPA